MSNYDFMNRNPVTPAPASVPIPGKEHQMVQNEAGGYAFPASGLTMLRRFLILGTTENQYYAERRTLTVGAVDSITGYLKENLSGATKELCEISASNRMISNSPAIYLLARIFSMGIPKWTSAAKAAMPQVIRTGAHLQEFTSYVRSMRKTGRAIRTAFETWLEARTDQDLMYQMLKYGNRSGYSWADMFALFHPRPKGDLRSAIYLWARFGGFPTPEYLSNNGKRMSLEQAHATLSAAQKAWNEDPIFAQARVSKELMEPIGEEISDKQGAAFLTSAIREHRLTHEMVTSAPLFAKHKRIGWATLAEKMPAHALLRSLNALSAHEALNKELKTSIVDFLTDREALKRAKIHPMNLLKTWFVYKRGTGVKGSLTWTPNANIVEALAKGFELCVQVQEPLKGRVLLAVDVSSSMRRAQVSGMPFMTSSTVAAAYAHVLLRGCEHPEIMYFDWKGWGKTQAGYSLVTKNLAECETLQDTFRFTERFGGCGTDCSIPVGYALEHKKHFDLFIMFTDGESWAGNHAASVLKQYRECVNPNARVVYCTTAPYGSVLTDPSDIRALDIVGFDPNAAALISEFHQGNL